MNLHISVFILLRSKVTEKPVVLLQTGILAGAKYLLKIFPQVMVRFAPGHQNQRSIVAHFAATAKAVGAFAPLVAQPVGFPVINRVSHFIFVAGNNQGRVKSELFLLLVLYLF